MLTSAYRFLVVSLALATAGCAVDLDYSSAGSNQIDFSGSSHEVHALTNPAPDAIVGMWYNRASGSGQVMTNSIVFRSDGTGTYRFFMPFPSWFTKKVKDIMTDDDGETASFPEDPEAPLDMGPSSMRYKFAIRWNYEGNGVWRVKYKPETLDNGEQTAGVIKDGEIQADQTIKDGVYQTDGANLIQTVGVFYHKSAQHSPVVWHHRELTDGEKKKQ